MVTSCCVRGCANRREAGNGLSFFRIPSKPNKKKRNAWITAINRAPATKSLKLWQPSKHDRVCSHHFETGRPHPDPFHPDYVPSKNLGDKKSKPAAATLMERFHRGQERDEQRQKRTENGTSLDAATALINLATATVTEELTKEQGDRDTETKLSQRKLSDEVIHTKLQVQELLDEAENIRRISEMSHLLVEFTQFVEAYLKYDVPADVMWSGRVYKSGKYKVVCGMVTSSLHTSDNVTQAKDASRTRSVSQMETLARDLVCYRISEDVKVDLTEDYSFLHALVLTLDAGLTPHLDNVLLDTQNLILVTCMQILHNYAILEKNIAILCDTRTVEVLLRYLKSHNGFIQLTSLQILARLVNEKETRKLRIENIFTLLIQRLDKAWHSSTHREDWGNHVCGLIETLRLLARNDANKQVLVEVGCLPVLVEILDSPYSDEVSGSLEVLWLLSFVEEYRMVNEPNLVKRVWGKYSDDPSDDEYCDQIKKSSYGILWSLLQQLKMGKLKFVGIAAKIEEQKNKADMEPKEQKTDADVKPAQDDKGRAQTKTSDDFSYPGHVMLSYNWRDKKTILKICQKLKAEGVPVWIDVDFMKGSRLETMAKAVEDCNIFIMAMSKGYKESPKARFEAGYADSLNKPIIPLKMDSGELPGGWLVRTLGSKMFHDFSSKDSFDKNISYLIRKVKTKMGHPKPAVANTKSDERKSQRESRTRMCQII